MTKVLVIDDEKKLIDVLTKGLALNNYTVVSASDGLEGIRLARDEHPDIIISDINMPDIDGYEVLQELRSDSSTANIPFIFLSSLASPLDVRSGMDLGADDYLPKPFGIDEVVKAIEGRLQRKKEYEVDRLHTYARNLVSIQETERQKISEMLRTDLLDVFSDLRVTLLLAQSLPKDAQQSVFETAMNQIDNTIDNITKTSYRLWPNGIHVHGLLPPLHLLFQQIKDQSGIQINFEHNGLSTFTEENTVLVVYRIVEEALLNAKQHARIAKVRVRVWTEKEQINIHIEDKGKGFNVEQSLRDPKNLGLLGMQKRAESIGGELVILSAVGEGTQILGTIPISKNPPTKHRSVPPPKAQNTESTPTLSTEIKPAETLQIFIADSNELSLWGIHEILKGNPNTTVIGKAESAEELLHSLQIIQIDILVLSNTLQGVENEMSFITALQKTNPKLRIILLSNYGEYAYASEALRHGADAYLLKAASAKELITALADITAGKQYISSQIVKPEEFWTNDQDKMQLESFFTLTDREKEVFYLVVNGYSNREVAEELIISPRTAETHRRNLMRKLGLKGTAALVRYAVDRSMVGKSLTNSMN